MGFASNPGTFGGSGEKTESIVGNEAKELMGKVWNEYKTTGHVSKELVKEVKKRNQEYFLQETAHGFFSTIAAVWAWINTFFVSKLESVDEPTGRYDPKVPNIGIWTDFLKWPTKTGISSRDNIPFREIFLKTSFLEREILQKQPQVLFVAVTLDSLPTLCPNLKFEFDETLQHTFHHQTEKEQVVRYGWNRWKGVGWVLVVHNTANPNMFGHLSPLEKREVGYRVRKLITEQKHWSYKL